MLTIMIPTMNRSEFLIRQLEYYARAGYAYQVAVADSSNDQHRRATEDAINGLAGRLRVEYYHLPKTSDYVCLKHLVDRAKTPYAVYCGDDDFLFIPGALRAIEFLEHNPDYTGANGRGATFTLDTLGPHGNFKSLGEYQQKGVEQAKAKDRLLSYAGGYFVSIFSVQRIEVWRKMYHDVDQVPDRCMGVETLPCFLSIIYGRIKHLDHLYIFRQVHDQRYTLPDVYDWLVGPLWGRSFEFTRGFLSGALKETDGIEQTSADRIIKQVFWRYLLTSLRKKYDLVYATAGWQVLRRKVARRLRNLGGRQGRLDLSVLLNPQSPYYKDFAPLYACVTQTL